jgi:hypothetical protein
MTSSIMVHFAAILGITIASERIAMRTTTRRTSQPWSGLAGCYFFRTAFRDSFAIRLYIAGRAEPLTEAPRGDLYQVHAQGVFLAVGRAD